MESSGEFLTKKHQIEEVDGKNQEKVKTETSFARRKWRDSKQSSKFFSEVANRDCEAQEQNIVCTQRN